MRTEKQSRTEYAPGAYIPKFYFRGSKLWLGERKSVREQEKPLKRSLKDIT